MDTYLENVSVLIQDAMLLMLVLHYTDRFNFFVVLGSALYVAGMWVGAMTEHVPLAVLGQLQNGALVLFCAARLPTVSVNRLTVFSTFTC